MLSILDIGGCYRLLSIIAVRVIISYGFMMEKWKGVIICVVLVRLGCSSLYYW